MTDTDAGKTQESEEHYRALFSSNYSISLLIEPDTGRITDANDAAVRYYRYTRDQLLSMMISDLNRLPEDKVVSDLKRAKNEREKHFFSTHYLAGGEKRSVEIYSGPITVQGKPLFYSIIHDITDRKEAETALRKSQYLLSEAMDLAQMADWEFDVPTGIFTFNDRFYALYGTTAAREGGYRMAADTYAKEFVHPDDSSMVAAEVNRAITTADPGYHAQLEHRIIRRDGEVRYITVRIRITKDATGRTIKTHGANQDITDRRQAEQALRESEERYRTLIDQIPDYVIVHRRGILLYVNPSAAARLGYSPEELAGKPITPFISPEYHKTVTETMMRRMEGGAVLPYEMAITAHDGSRHTVLVNGALIRYMGEPASLNVLTDITPLKQAEETIRQANEALEKRVAERTEALTVANVQMEEEIAARRKAEQEISRSLAEKELLLREIHHRVKNNLQIIISLLNLQSRHIHDPNVLDAIQDSQNRVRAMALVHERIYRSPSLATINLKDYIRYLVNQLFGFYTIPHSRVGVTIDMEDYPADIDMAIPIGLILNELVTNSIKHAFPEGKTGEISIGCTQPDAHTLRFVYRDNGTGFPGDFDWKTSESLGLRLVNSLVDQLDGTIEKGTGEGTMFIITLHRKPTGGSP
jgi:two-component system, sensor histidine kinase PdtaS